MATLAATARRWGNAGTVTGPGSVWTNINNLYVGDYGSGNTLTITNGGQVFDAIGYVGMGGNSNGVIVTGAGSIWSNTSLYVGTNSSYNTLTIANIVLTAAPEGLRPVTA